MNFDSVELPSDRRFGLFFALVAFGLSAYTLWQQQAALALALGVVGCTFAAIAVTRAAMLRPLNRLWMKLGLLLGAIIGPLVLGLIFFGLFTPLALCTRLFGRDELRLAPDANLSFWREREPPGPTADTFQRQF